MTATHPEKNVLNTAFSPCPNDTFMFHALLNGRIDTKGLDFVPHLYDIDALNQMGFSKTFDITKLSFYAALKLRDSYTMLDAGNALGFGCGPLLVGLQPEEFTSESLVAIPGELTTANLLMRLWDPRIKRTVVDRFDSILQGVANGSYDAGLIIHEGRFVYPDHGCKKIVDLGEWWEETTGLPIPLGCIAVNNSSPAFGHREEIAMMLKDSIQYAFDHPRDADAFVKAHAREMDGDVISRHIDLYVNDFSLALGETGKKAVSTLQEMAWKADIL